MMKTRRSSGPSRAWISLSAVQQVVIRHTKGDELGRNDCGVVSSDVAKLKTYPVLTRPFDQGSFSSLKAAEERNGSP